MNQQAKRAIKSLVLDLRHKLEDDIAIQLKRYGFAGERWLPLSRLPHIEEDNQATIERFRLEAALEQHLRRIGADPSGASAKQRAEAVDWFVREVAFTHLNRLVAMKCLEVRELIPEIITTRDTYGGRSRAHRDYRNAHPEKARQPDEALPAAIRDVCRQVYAEFKFLFDVGDPAADREPPANTILWPSMPVLKECIALINGLGDETENQGRTLWAEDEIIGWIYQFYNVEEKEAIRSRGRPRRPGEIAVINQFFTPRWIVKFLVDNTLGRLWLEMHPDSERVRAKCDYLVPEALEAEETESRRDTETRGEGEIELDPESPINNADAEPRREPKTPQDLRLIDPACGTMHFGHYAFEVFQKIYEDAIERGWANAPEESIAASILRHNLYGVDIDLRAVQLAGLSLFIKAKSADPDSHVSHLNLVVADAVLPTNGARRRFLDQYADDKVVQDAVRQVLQEMENVAEVGSLLRVEERLRDILGEAGHAAVASWDTEKQRDLPGFEPQTRQLSLAETAGAKPEEWDAHYTVARLMEDLREFAAEALQTHDLNALLFAQEAEKTVRLLDVFLTDYDVALMNPPYGRGLDEAKEMLKSLYPDTYNDLYCMFVERGLDYVYQAAGYVGSITSRTFIRLTTFDEFREKMLLGKHEVITLADLGWGVLDDALNETAAYVVGPAGHTDRSVFVRLNESVRKEKDLLNALKSLSGESKHPLVSIVALNEFGLLPGSPLCYWTTTQLRRKFSDLRELHPEVAYVGTGTSHPRLFCRYHWEIRQEDIGPGKKWVGYANGGSRSLCYRDIDQVTDWEDDGRRPKEEVCRRYPYLNGNYGFVIQSEDYYFREGITYGKRSKFFSVQHLPSGNVFSNEGQSIFPAESDDIWPLLGLLNGAPVCYYLLLTAGIHKERMYVRRLPVPELSEEDKKSLSELARTAHDCKAAWDASNETCTHFSSPWLVQISELESQGISGRRNGMRRVVDLLGDGASRVSLSSPVTLQVLLDAARDTERAADIRLQALQRRIDELAHDIYEVSEQDRRLIELELEDRPAETVWTEMEGKSDEEKRCEHVRRLLSYFLLQALKEKRDGIVAFRDGAGGTTALAEVRRRMAKAFGEEAAFSMESEIKQVLGRDIADWLDGPFIKWHTKLYKRRPIIWQLSSDDYHNTFNCFVYYHALDADTLQKVRTQYLWPQRRALQSVLESAQRDQRESVSGASSRVEDAEEDLEVLAAFEKKLLSVIEGATPYTPPDWAEGPIRNGVYDPVLDDGVKVNIMPLQKARILRYKRLV